MKIPSKRLLSALTCLALASSVGASVASSDPPLDLYGRPLSDAAGPLHYREVDGAWFVRHADGSVAPAPAATAAPSLPGVASSGLNPYLTHPVGSWAEAVAIGDVTADGRPDVVMTTTFYFDPQNDDCVFVFAQQPDGTLGPPARFPYLATANRNGIVLTDLDEDGVLDVVVGHQSGLTVLRADGHGSLLPGVVTLDDDANTLAAMDVDRDGHRDVISLGWSRGATIFYGDGHGGFSHKTALATVANGYNDHEVADLSGDGYPDLAVMSGQSLAPNLTIHRHNGVSGFLPTPTSYSMGYRELTSGIGLGDVSGDGLNDVVLSHSSNSPTWLFIMTQNPSGGLLGPTTVPSYDIPEPVEVADIDGDGLEDVVVLHGGWNRVGVYHHLPAGGLSAEALFPVPYASHYAPQGLAVGDFNSDGCADVAFASYGYGLVTMTGNQCAGPTATQLSLVSANATPDRVELRWYAGGTSLEGATVDRRAAGEDWQSMGAVSVDGTGLLVYVDTSVQPGTRYDYRVGVREAGGEVFLGETRVEVPARAELALFGFRSNPARGEVWVKLSLPDAASTRLEVFDVFGRKIESRDVGELGPGSHAVKLRDGALAPGAYLLRLTRPDRSLTARGVVVR